MDLGMDSGLGLGRSQEEWSVKEHMVSDAMCIPSICETTRPRASGFGQTNDAMITISKHIEHN